MPTFEKLEASIYSYHRTPLYSKVKLPNNVIEDNCLKTKDQISLKQIIEKAKSGDAIRTESLITLGGARTDRITPAITKLIYFIVELHKKGVLVEFTNEPWINDPKIWESLEKFQKGIELECKMTTKRKIIANGGKLKGRPKVKPDLILLRQLASKKLSNSKLAEQMGVSRVTLSKWKKEGLF